MSEFINVTEVEKLPLNKVDSLIAIDANNRIKRTAITVDQEVIPESTNPVSSKGVYDIIVVLGNDFGEVVDDLENHLGAFENNIREEISALNEEYATKEWVGDEIEKAIREGVDLTGYATEQWVNEQGFLTEPQDISGLATKDEVLNAVEGLASEAYVGDKIAAIEFPETDLTGYATETYVNDLIGDINSVLDQINGEVV